MGLILFVFVFVFWTT